MFLFKGSTVIAYEVCCNQNYSINTYFGFNQALFKHQIAYSLNIYF